MDTGIRENKFIDVQRRNVSLVLDRLPCRWAKDSIVVMDEVIIAPPYEPENCKANASASYTLARVKKVVSWIHSYRRATCARTTSKFSSSLFFFFFPLLFFFLANFFFCYSWISWKGRGSVWPMDANRVASYY